MQKTARSAIHPGADRSPGRRVESSIALLPERRRPNGPVTAGRLRRTLAIYGGLWATGVALVVLSASDRLTGFGLGLIAPGAGLFYHGHWLPALLTLGLFVAALLLWLGSGNVLAPLLVWFWPVGVELLHEPAEPWSATEWIAPAATAALVVAGLIGREVGFRAAKRRAERRNAYLRELASAADPAQGGANALLGGNGAGPGATNGAGPVTTNGSPVGVGPELSPDELALARFALDRALQPIPEFNGFDRIEQFQSAAVRYQVCTAGYALAALQYSRTPAFHGYLSEAQRNLIAKMQERICWSYWAKENLWGNLRLDPDPVPRDNIMLSGWMGYLVAGYVSNTGDQRYWQPASISFKHPDGRSFDYDLHSLTEALVRNFTGSDFCLFPCEPNWIFALCNGWGVLPLPIHDRLRGSDYCAQVLPEYRRNLENEFVSPDGRIIGIRSSLTGFSLPAMTSMLSDCAVIYQLSPVLPDIARRTWEIVRREFIDLSKDPIDFALKGWDRADTGNHRRRPVTAHMATMWAAREMGDDEVVERAQAAVDERFDPVTEDGVKRYRGASVQANLGLLLGVAARPGEHADRVARGLPDAWGRGPILDEAAYPDVLVARAVSDGEALELVLHPGDGGGRRGLGLARLIPGRSYHLRGTVERAVTADEAGRAWVQVDLESRLEVRVVPAA